MSSPMSGKGTLDKIINYCQDKYICTMESEKFPQCTPSYKSKFVVEGRFVFQASDHSTGCDVVCWIVSDDGDAYNIIRTTYWYLSSYTSNESKWEQGSWDTALNMAIGNLRKLAGEHKDKSANDAKIYRTEKNTEKQVRKSKFEALFFS